MAAETFPAGLRVLAVDGDRVSLKVLERQLKYCNYNVTMVTDAQTALEMLRERKKGGDQFDLVICDVYMPGMDGFELLKLIGQEMDLPVILLSANNETQTIMKGIKYGACDYMVKPVRLEQLRGIWIHVVKNGKTDPRNSISSGCDHVVRELASGDGDKVENLGENHTKKYSRKNKKAVVVADVDNENTSTQKKHRVQWCGQLHQKFVQAVRQIGMERAVPKKILEVMNVEGLTRESVASHLRKYRIYLRNLSEGTLKNSNPFADETEALQRYMNVPSIFSACSSNNVNLPKDVPMPVQDISRFISSGKSYAPVTSGGLPGASQCFPSGPSGCSFANSSNGVVLNASKPFSVDISGSSFANISNDSAALTSSSCSSYASILRAKILRSSRGIPFEDISEGDMLAPSGHLPLQSPNLVQFNKVASEAHQTAGPSSSWKAAVPSTFSDLGQVAASSCGNNTHTAATLIGNSALSSSSITISDLHIDNSAMPTQVLNGGGASDNLHVGSTVNQQAVSDHVNKISEFLMGTSGAQNGESDDYDDILANLVDQDFINNDDPFIDGDWEFAP